MRLRLLLPLFALLLAVAACDDAPGVGLDLVNDGGGVPEGRRVFVDALGTGEDEDITGSSTSLPTATPQRVHAGLVQDPSLGTVGAAAAVEFGAPSGATLTSFRTKPVEKATLTLPVARYYGDTTSAVTYELRTLARELASISIPSDSALATTGPVVATVTVNRRDTMLTVPMPAAWLAANDSRLRAEGAPDSLHGFLLTAVSGGQIRSIPIASARLVAIAGVDTATFTGVRGATRVMRTGTPALAPTERLLQDGFPVRLVVPFDTTGIGDVALARVTLVIPYDTTRLATPAGFLRPAPTRLDLYGLDEKNALVAFSGAPFGLNTPSKGRVLFSSEALRRVFQDRKLGRTNALRAFSVAYSDVPGGLGAVVVSTTGPNRPYFVFTTVPY